MALDYEDVHRLLSTFMYKPNVRLVVEPPGRTSYEPLNCVAVISLVMYAPDSRRTHYPPPKLHERLDDFASPYNWATRPLASLITERYWTQDLPLIEVYATFYVQEKIADELEFWPWLRERFGEVEEHERDEFFRVNGVAIFDPHKRSA